MSKNPKFNMMDLLNQRSKEITEQSETAAEKEAAADATSASLDIYDLIPSKNNFYNTESIQDLKQSIELLGVLQPLLVSEEDENRKHGLIAGHRRRLAILALVEEGKEQFRFVPCLIKPKKNAILDRLALIMANRFREKTDWERMTETLETEQLVLELKETMDIPGRTRDLLAEIVETSPAQVGRYKAISNNLSPELMAEFKANNIGISVIYEASGLAKDYQQQAFELFKENEVLSLADIKGLKKQEEVAQQIPGQLNLDQIDPLDQQEQSEEGMAADEKTDPAAADEDPEEDQTEDPEEFDPQPDKVTSICYSCLHWNDCGEKSNTVTNCDTYENKAEAEKTDEQRYSDEQDRIDKETAKKLREMQDTDKMQHLPSDSKTDIHEIRLPASRYTDITSGLMTFLLLKNEKFKVGEELEMTEYLHGKPTGRVINANITYMLDDYTGLVEDYCILGFIVTAYSA